MTAITITPPIPNPDRKRLTTTSDQEDETAVTIENIPKQAVDRMSDLALPVLSEIIPQAIPPNIHPKMNRELIRALMPSCFCCDKFPAMLCITDGKYTGIRMEIVPARKTLRKQILKTRISRWVETCLAIGKTTVPVDCIVGMLPVFMSPVIIMWDT